MLLFQTNYTDSLLFYMSGSTDSIFSNQFLSVSLSETGNLVLEASFGLESQTSEISQEFFSDNKWHNVTIIHQNERISFSVDEYNSDMEFPNPDESFFLVDKSVYFGGFGEFDKS